MRGRHGCNGERLNGDKNGLRGGVVKKRNKVRELGCDLGGEDYKTNGSEDGNGPSMGFANMNEI